MVEHSENRQLAAIVFTDLVGFTELMEADEDQARKIVRTQRALVEDCAHRHDGRVLKEMGDGLLLMFPSGVNALRCAIAIQEAEKEYALRIGVHIGDVVIDGEEVYGSGVNIAARIEPLAPPGGISLTQDVWRQASNQTGLRAISLGTKSLKGIKEPLEVYQLELPGSEGSVSPVASFRMGGRPVMFSAMALFVAAAVFFSVNWFVAPPDSDSELIQASSSPSLAVLPFDYRGPNPEDAYFAGGLHDELLTQFARVADLSLRGRNSVRGYVDTTKPTRQIAEELQVGALLEGSVQVLDGRLRVRVQLVDAADEHLWAESYDGTLDDAFAIQSDVARRVVMAVGAALESGEEAAITAKPSDNPEAYRLYLQALDYFQRPGSQRDDLEIAQQLLERAVTLDPAFAEAHAALARVHGDMHWFQHDLAPERLEAQLESAETAVALAPDMPQARRALALWQYQGQRDWEAALAEAEVALQQFPNDTESWLLSAIANRRLGNWEDALAAAERATELDPRNARYFMDPLGTTYFRMRHYSEAVEAFERALSLSPDYHQAAIARGWAYVHWQGDFEPLRSALEAVPVEQFVMAPVALLLMERNVAGIHDYLEGLEIDVFHVQAAYHPKSLYAAWAYQVEGDSDAARAAFASARERLEIVPESLEADWRVIAARGLAMAGLGEHQQALDKANILKQSVSYRDDPVLGGEVARQRAWILAHVGEAEAAIDEIERLLAQPSVVSVYTLRLDPRWDPVRDHPRFQHILARDENP